MSFAERMTLMALALVAWSACNNARTSTSAGGDAGVAIDAGLPMVPACQTGDAAPNERWVRCAANQLRMGLGTPYALAVDGERNLVVAGSFTGRVRFGPHELVARNRAAAFVAKYDPRGRALWAAAIGGSQYLSAGDVNTRAWSVAAAADGSVAVGGWYLGDADFGRGITLAGETRDNGATHIPVGFVARFDRDGRCVWARRLTAQGRALGLGMDADANVYVASSGYGRVGPFDVNGPFVAKIGALGDEQWVRLGAADFGTFADSGALHVDAAGGAVTSAGVASALRLDGGTLDDTNRQLFVTEYDTTGRERWRFVSPLEAATPYVPVAVRRYADHTLVLGQWLHVGAPGDGRLALYRFDGRGALVAQTRAAVAELIELTHVVATFDADGPIAGFLHPQGTRTTLIAFTRELRERARTAATVRITGLAADPTGALATTAYYVAPVTLADETLAIEAPYDEGLLIWKTALTR